MPVIEKHTPGSFSWFELVTSDQNGAKQFYSGLFNWSINDFPLGPNDVYTMFQIEGRDVGAAHQSQQMPPHWGIYVAVENADQIAQKASQLGGKVIAQPFDVFDSGRMAAIQDPTGAAFGVWQAKQHIGTGITGTDGTVCWADLNTSDPQKAAQFYGSLFGWDLRPSEHDSSGYLHIQNQGEYIGGIPPVREQAQQAPPHWLLYFQVRNCDASTDKAKQLGAQVYVAPMTIPEVGRWSIVADPQGAVFAIFQDKSTL